MAKKTVADVDVRGKKVLMRVDFNVPIEGGKITDDRRIAQALPTIKDVVGRGGRLILMSHLGRPKGGPEAKYSLKPAADRLSQILGMTVKFAEGCIGPVVQQQANSLKDGEVLLLENLRFHKEEEKNDPNFAKELAKLGDVYVNDAFGTAHREHSSTFGAAQALAGKPRVIGQLIQKRIEIPRRGDQQSEAAVRRHPRRSQGVGQDQRYRAVAGQGGSSADRRSDGVYVFPGTGKRSRQESGRAG